MELLIYSIAGLLIYSLILYLIIKGALKSALQPYLNAQVGLLKLLAKSNGIQSEEIEQAATLKSNPSDANRTTNEITAMDDLALMSVFIYCQDYNIGTVKLAYREAQKRKLNFSEKHISKLNEFSLKHSIGSFEKMMQE